MPQVRRAGLRRRSRITCASNPRPTSQALQVQDRQGHPAAAHRPAQAARLLAKGKTDLFRRVHFRQDRPAVPRLPGHGRRRQGHVRFPAARGRGDEDRRLASDAARDPPSHRSTTSGSRSSCQHLGHGSWRLDLHAAQLPPGAEGISSLAPGGAAAAARRGDNCSGMTFAPTCASWAGTIWAAPPSTSASPPCGRSTSSSSGTAHVATLAHQEPGPAEAWKAAAEVPDAAADGRSAGRAAQAPAVAGRDRFRTGGCGFRLPAATWPSWRRFIPAGCASASSAGWWRRTSIGASTSSACAARARRNGSCRSANRR